MAGIKRKGRPLIKISLAVTTSGDSDSQRSAGVSGAGVKAGANVAGSLRPSSCDRKSTEVAGQAPVTLLSTRTASENTDEKFDVPDFHETFFMYQ